MFNGSVNFVADVRGNGITFPSLDFNPNVAGVDHVTIEAPDPGDQITAVVHLVNVNTQDDGRRIAQKVVTDALNRIAYHHGMAIQSSRSTGDQFMPVNAGAGALGTVAVGVHLFLQGAAHAVVGIPADQIKDKLEQATPPGEHNFGMYRSALRSTSPVEKFMHLYNILLMLYGDKQAAVDAFIVGEEPGVAQTPDPRFLHKNPQPMETVYTRLRNELGHKRQNVDLDTTKSQMEAQVSGLAALVKRAIELHP